MKIEKWVHLNISFRIFFVRHFLLNLELKNLTFIRVAQNFQSDLILQKKLLKWEKIKVNVLYHIFIKVGLIATFL